MSVTFSCEKPSGTASTVLYPRPQPISASPTPVLPAVASKMVAPGCKLAVAFGLGDHAQRGAVFDAAARIQVFELGINIGGAGGNQLAKMKDGSFADQFGDVFGDPEGSHFGSLHGHLGGDNAQGYVKVEEVGQRRTCNSPLIPALRSVAGPSRLAPDALHYNSATLKARVAELYKEKDHVPRRHSGCVCAGTYLCGGFLLGARECPAEHGCGYCCLSRTNGAAAGRGH